MKYIYWLYNQISNSFYILENYKFDISKVKDNNINNQFEDSKKCMESILKKNGNRKIILLAQKIPADYRESVKDFLDNYPNPNIELRLNGKD